MVVVDGYIGNDREFRTRARLVIEASNANVAGMQQLYFPGEWSHGDVPDSEPVTTVVYTPNLAVDGYPDDRAMLVDLDNNVTRVMNSDYFGESKKAGLRMWNNIVYKRGGYSIATSLPGVDDIELLQPRRLYERQGRLDDYTSWVDRLKRERRAHLESFPGLDRAIVASIDSSVSAGSTPR